MPLISVVVPCYNAAPYLEACIESLRGQTLADIQVLIIDDGSTDGSGALADALAATDARIQVIHGANAGVSAARNTGIDAASGLYIAFVDADDTLEPRALDILYAAIAQDPGLDIVSARHRERYPDGRCRAFKPGRRCRRRMQVLARLIEGDSVYNSMCNKLYRRTLLNQQRIRALPGLRIGEDALFNLEAYAHGERVAHLPVVTYEYRIHGASAMRAIPQEEHYAQHLPWLAAMRGVLSRLGLRDAFFCHYCFSHTLRLYKSYKFGGVLRAFNAQARPAVLEGVNPQQLHWGAKALYLIVRGGLFPTAYCFIWPTLRARDALKRAGRYAVHWARKPLRWLRKEGAACA